jgi:hypothetical protein
MNRVFRTGTVVLSATDADVPSLFTGKPSKLSPAELTTKLFESNVGQLEVKSHVVISGIVAKTRYRNG